MIPYSSETPSLWYLQVVTQPSPMFSVARLAAVKVDVEPAQWSSVPTMHGAIKSAGRPSTRACDFSPRLMGLPLSPSKVRVKMVYHVWFLAPASPELEVLDSISVVVSWRFSGIGSTRDGMNPVQERLAEGNGTQVC